MIIISNLVALALTTEVIVSKIHKACRLRKTDVSISFIDAIQTFTADRSCACFFNKTLEKTNKRVCRVC